MFLPGGLGGEQRGRGEEQSTDQSEGGASFCFPESVRLFIGGDGSDPLPHLLHAPAHAGSKGKGHMRNLFGKIDQSCAVFFVVAFGKPFQDGGVAGDLPVAAHFFQGIPYQRIAPVEYAGQGHKETGQRVFVSVML